MNIKELSIIVPVYNVEKYLKECLDSINEIRNIDYELIIVNDGSPDNSQKIIEEFCKKNERAKYYIKENGGLSSARNYGLEKARGEYVWFVDSDDVIIASEFEKFFLETKKEKLDIFCGNYITFEDGKNIKIKEIRYIKSEEKITGKEFLKIWGEKVIVTGSVCKNIYKRKFLNLNKLFFEEGIYAEDLLFTLLSNMKAEKVKYFDIYFYMYRTKRAGSIMNIQSNEHNKKWGLSKKIIVEKLMENIEFFEEYVWLKRKMISFYLEYVKFNEKRDMILEKKLWKLTGIFSFKIKRRVRLLKWKYLYRIIK